MDDSVGFVMTLIAILRIVSGRTMKSTVWSVLVEGSGPVHVIHLWTFAGDHHVRVHGLTGYIDASISGRLGTATSVHRHGSVRCWCPSLDWAVALMKVLAQRRCGRLDKLFAGRNMEVLVTLRIGCTLSTRTECSRVWRTWSPQSFALMLAASAAIATRRVPQPGDETYFIFNLSFNMAFLWLTKSISVASAQVASIHCLVFCSVFSMKLKVTVRGS